MENHKKIDGKRRISLAIFFVLLNITQAVFASTLCCSTLFGVSNDKNAVGTPEGDLTVSNSGAAVYNVKIKVPDGGPLTPQIGLSYDSQFCSYGYVGYGVNITGLSVITRGGHNLFDEGPPLLVLKYCKDSLISKKLYSFEE